MHVLLELLLPLLPLVLPLPLVLLHLLLLLPLPLLLLLARPLWSCPLVNLSVQLKQKACQSELSNGSSQWRSSWTSHLLHRKWRRVRRRLQSGARCTPWQDSEAVHNNFCRNRRGLTGVKPVAPTSLSSVWRRRRMTSREWSMPLSRSCALLANVWSCRAEEAKRRRAKRWQPSDWLRTLRVTVVTMPKS